MARDVSDLPHVDDSLLAAADDAIRSGRTPDFASTPPDFGETAFHLRESIACLERLEQLWPRAAAPAPEPLIPERIGRFEIKGVLGRGGFGVVLLAHDPTLQRPVALKLPRPEVLVTPEQRQRFVQEARASAQLEHPHIVQVYEAGDLNGVLYIASAYCPGGDLAAWLRRHPQPIDVQLAAQIVATLATAVQHAHERGIIHRDLKPSNVLLVSPTEATGDDDSIAATLRVADFGLAKVLESQLADTGSSLLIGTPHYMSPEQADGRGNDSTAETDIYGLGAILYELLTGAPPFVNANVVTVFDELRTQSPTPPSTKNPAVSGDLETICLKCLHKRPEQRYATAGELAADLRRFLRGEPIAARRLSPRELFANWSRRRERMRDAGVITMVGAGVMLAWDIVLMGVQLASDGRSEFIRDGSLAWGLGFAVFYYGPLIWLGWQAFQKRWASCVVLGGATVFVLFFLASIMAPAVRGPIEEFFRSTLPTGLLTAAIQVGIATANLIALSAHRARRGG